MNEQRKCWNIIDHNSLTNKILFFLSLLFSTFLFIIILHPTFEHSQGNSTTNFKQKPKSVYYYHYQCLCSSNMEIMFTTRQHELNHMIICQLFSSIVFISFLFILLSRLLLSCYRVKCSIFTFTQSLLNFVSQKENVFEGREKKQENY